VDRQSSPQITSEVVSSVEVQVEEVQVVLLLLEEEVQEEELSSSSPRPWAVHDVVFNPM
jgi:hypothetical protein